MTKILKEREKRTPGKGWVRLDYGGKKIFSPIRQYLGPND